MYKNILIATDGSELADKAVLNGIKLAKELNSDVVIVNVTEPWSALEIASSVDVDPQAIEHFEANVAQSAHNILSVAAENANEMKVGCEILHVKDKHPSEGIIETANSKKIELIVLASHGRRGIKRALLGSVANEVIAHSTIPVLVYR